MGIRRVAVAVAVQVIASYPSVEDIGLPPSAQRVISLAATNAIVPVESIDSIVTCSGDNHIRSIGPPDFVRTIRSNNGCVLPVAFLRAPLRYGGEKKNRDGQHS